MVRHVALSMPPVLQCSPLALCPKELDLLRRHVAPTASIHQPPPLQNYRHCFNLQTWLNHFKE
jgi:hypothetical protein